MSYLVRTILLLASTAHGLSQELSMATLGGSQTDRGVGIENAIGGDGYVMVGFTKSFGAKGEDVYLVRTDSSGKLLWQKTYGGAGDDNGWAVRKTPDDHYLIAGFSNSYGKGDWDILLIKTDRDGNEIWTKNFGGPKDEFAWDLLVITGNEFVVIGQTNSTAAGTATTLWIKIDDSGNLLWENQLDDAMMNRAFSLVSGKGGKMYFGGLIASEGGDLDGMAGAIRPDGSLQWYHRYGGTRDDVVHSLGIGASGDVLLFGYSKSYNAGNNSPWLVKTDARGREFYNDTYGSALEERIVAGYAKNDGSCLMLGYSIKGDKRDGDLLLLDIGAEGKLSWKQTYGGALNEESGQRLLLDPEGDILFTGRTFSQGGGEGDLFLARVTVNKS